MTAAQFEDLRVDEAAEVLAWRFDALCRSGYDLDAAAVLAANVEVDLHDAVGARAARLPARARDENSAVARRRDSAEAESRGSIPACGGADP